MMQSWAVDEYDTRYGRQLEIRIRNMASLAAVKGWFSSLVIGCWFKYTARIKYFGFSCFYGDKGIGTATRLRGLTTEESGFNSRLQK
jgi:hypothetical protein